MEKEKDSAKKKTGGKPKEAEKTAQISWLTSLSPAPGSKKRRKRVGRGTSSGHGNPQAKQPALRLARNLRRVFTARVIICDYCIVLLIPPHRLPDSHRHKGSLIAVSIPPTAKDGNYTPGGKIKGAGKYAR